MSSQYKLEARENGRGHLVAIAVHAPDAEWEAEQAKRSRERKIRQAEIPPRVQPMLDAPKATPAVEAVGRFMAPGGGKTILLLVGGPGTGKTVAACWGALLATSAKYAKASIAFGERSGFDEDYWEGLRQAELLVIDDLGAEAIDAKGWANSKIDSLIDYRYDWERKTIITSNLPLDALKARYMSGPGVRTLDRIREVGTVVQVPGESMRKPVAP